MHLVGLLIYTLSREVISRRCNNRRGYVFSNCIRGQSCSVNWKGLKRKWYTAYNVFNMSNTEILNLSYSHRLMDGWMSGWVDERMGGRMNGRKDGQMDGLAVGCISNCAYVII